MILSDPHFLILPFTEELHHTKKRPNVLLFNLPKSVFFVVRCLLFNVPTSLLFDFPLMQFIFVGADPCVCPAQHRTNNTANGQKNCTPVQF